MSIHVIPPKPPSKPNFRTFMVVVEKDESTTWHQIESSLNFSLLDSRGNQVKNCILFFLSHELVLEISNSLTSIYYWNGALFKLSLNTLI